MVLTHLKPPRRFYMLFFDVLLFTRRPSTVKLQRKASQNDAAVFGVSWP